MLLDCINYSVTKGSPGKPQYLDGKSQWTDAKEGKKLIEKKKAIEKRLTT